MPRIDENILDSVIFLYDSEDDAKQGNASGGSGFLFAIPFKDQTNGELRSHVYAVTNWHVIIRKPTWIRLNKFFPFASDSGIISTLVSDWHFNGIDDLAVCQLDDQDLVKRGFRYFMYLPEGVVTPKLMIEQDIGIGSDVINVGRFFMYDGKQQNTPLARFGTIAAVNVKVKYRAGILPPQESFIIDGRSIMGLSGSPIYHVILNPDKTETLHLLGIVWGHSEFRENVTDDQGNGTGTYAMVNSGLLHAIPAWKLLSLLDDEDLRMKREEIERQAIEGAEKHADEPRAVLDMLNVQDVPEGNQADDEGYESSEDFHNVLDRVIRPIKPDTDVKN